MNNLDYLKLANEAGRKIREINQLISGTKCPEDKSMLGNIKNSVFSMVQIYLAPIVRKEIDSDELCNMTTQIMFAEENEIDKIIQKIMDSAHER